MKMEHFFNIGRYKHTGFILDGFDKEKIEQFNMQKDDEFSILNRTREITITPGKILNNKCFRDANTVSCICNFR